MTSEQNHEAEPAADQFPYAPGSKPVLAVSTARTVGLVVFGGLAVFGMFVLAGAVAVALLLGTTGSNK